MNPLLTSRRRAYRALPALLTLAFLGATTGAQAERRPARATTPPESTATLAPAPSSADPALEAAVDRLRSASSSIPSPALGRGFESLDMIALARTAEGHVRALSAPPGRALPLPRGVGGGDAAAAFLRRHALAFGVAKPDVSFVTDREKTVGKSSVVRLRQEFRSIPVFGAEALVQIGPGGVEFVLADLARDHAELHVRDFDTTPSTGKEAAQSVALSLVRDAASAPDLVVDEPHLVIFEPSVIGEAGPSQLVWQLRVRSETATVDELVLVDAHVGDVAFHFSQIKEAKARSIYDAANVSGSLGSLVRSEGDPATGIVDADLAYRYLGDTYDFYFNRFGRDSLNGFGLPLHARVRYCDPGYACPYANAYWNGTEMRFGDGYAAADDVVAHELTHGVTESESNLIYWNEAGAINESLSDIFGEFVDQTNSGGTDTPAVRWKLGEDVPGVGAIRDMADPTVFLDPDRRTSDYWYPLGGDNRGVHTNSGVANKLAFLLTDGGTFNGQTVAAQGITKVARLFYEADANLLVAGSDYVDLYYVLRQAAINLGWTPDARAAVERACRAVEIAVPASVTTIVTDDFESGMGKWAVSDPANTGAAWGLSTYRKSGGSYSAWCAGGGASPAPPGGPYKPNMETWMKYGPFSLAGASRSWFEFDLRLYSEPGYDKVATFVSVDGVYWYGYELDNSTTGFTSSGFVREMVDMKDLERLFSSYGVVIVGQPQVWVAFRFRSDATLQYEGNYVDNFALYKGGGAAPFGSFDTPTSGATGVTGAIPATGWALDDVEVTKVGIYRDPLAGEPTQPNGKVYLGDAVFIPGARSDVDGIYSSYPFSYNAGWGLQVLTNMLPASGNGTFTLHAYASDVGNPATLLGSKTITCTNSTATLPFGTIDTPGQGVTASGTVVNFGWALTPQPANIPTNGSTIWVFVDNVPVGHPVYNNYRSDIATLFPGYANTNGAIGYYMLDTTTLANGIHTIAWSVTDSLGRVSGLGSRYFWVQN
jgi:hypothetical protein